MQKLTKEQAAIIGAYTGFTAGPFIDVHEYAERVLDRRIWTHEFAYKDLSERLQAAAKNDFLSICFDGDA